jgi:SAM-dependent methyltransferase
MAREQGADPDDGLDYLLFPGRHHVLTRFQLSYLGSVLESGGVFDSRGEWVAVKPSASVVWAITSADHANTRRNPIPVDRRVAACELADLELGGNGIVALIPDVPQSDRFANYVLTTIDVQSRSRVQCRPDNTLLVCSTPPVIEQYERLGFRAATAELGQPSRDQGGPWRPWELVTRLASVGSQWSSDRDLKTWLHPASAAQLHKYGLDGHIVELFADPLLGDEGDLTETRDYATYIASFDGGADRKWELVKDVLRPGRVVDIGCAAGAVLERIAKDDRFAESDLYGIEITRRLYEECVHRKATGRFENENTFFHLRNITNGPLFTAASVDTFTTFSLTHEIISYQGLPALQSFLESIFDQTAVGGVYVNVDVCGPEDGDRIVELRCSSTDGTAEHHHVVEPSPDFLRTLSTAAKLRQFAKDFRAHEGDGIAVTELAPLPGQAVFQLTIRDAMEFASKKDYVDNWLSECHEKFCTYSFSEWAAALGDVGFELTGDSRAYANPWIVENRFVGCMELIDPASGRALEWPDTNVLLVAERPRVLQLQVKDAAGFSGARPEPEPTELGL